IIWIAVFHLARRDTGSPTRNAARYSRRPETRISRHRITSAGKRAHSVLRRPLATSMNKIAATSSLSAIGSRNRPSSDCWAPRRALDFRNPGARDRARRAEMVQQRLLAAGADARDLIERRAADRLLAADPMRADRKTVRLVAQALQEVEDRVTRLEREGRPAG